MSSILDRYPKSWLTPATIFRGGGRTAQGLPAPETQVELRRVLMAGRTSAEPVDRSEVTDGNAILYADPGTVILHSDRIRIPAGSRMAGDWSVEGRPSEWPLGVEVGMVRA